MFKISEFARLTRVSTRMLRYYDETGLLKPKEVDPFTGYRYYSAGQISWLKEITALRDMGFLVAEISLYLHEEEPEKKREILERKRKEVLEEIRERREKLDQLDHMSSQVGGHGEGVEFAVEVVSLAPCYAVCLRRSLPSYWDEGELWAQLGSYIQEKGILVNGEGFALMHGEDDQGQCDVEICVPVSQVGEEGMGVVYRQVDGAKTAARITVKGPFSLIAPAYEALAQWMEREGWRMDGPAREAARKGPHNVQHPMAFETDIFIPVTRG